MHFSSVSFKRMGQKQEDSVAEEAQMNTAEKGLYHQPNSGPDRDGGSSLVDRNHNGPRDVTGETSAYSTGRKEV